MPRLGGGPNTPGATGKEGQEPSYSGCTPGWTYPLSSSHNHEIDWHQPGMKTAGRVSDTPRSHKQQQGAITKPKSDRGERGLGPKSPDNRLAATPSPGVRGYGANCRDDRDRQGVWARANGSRQDLTARCVATQVKATQHCTTQVPPVP